MHTPHRSPLALPPQQLLRLASAGLAATVLCAISNSRLPQLPLQLPTWLTSSAGCCSCSRALPVTQLGSVLTVLVLLQQCSAWTPVVLVLGCRLLLQQWSVS
jgi:hypothetical protein